MRRPAVGRVALGIIGLGLGIGGVFALREATLSTHQPVPPGSQLEVVVSARNHGGEPTQHLEEMVEAHLLTCRLEVNSDLTGPIEPLGDDAFSAVLSPALDETNRRQFKGCLEDFVIDHLQIDVLRFE